MLCGLTQSSIKLSGFDTYLRKEFDQRQHDLSADIGEDDSIHINIPRHVFEGYVKSNEILSQLHGQSNSWQADLAHMSSGKVTWKLAYIGDETLIQSLIYEISSNHTRRKGLIGNSRDITKVLVYEWTTYLGKNGHLSDETILLKISGMIVKK
ncbi:hypothetical protein [Cohnella lupini]|uniref:Uncharacterized protein n=1 Tax=Cohnella lupini TaxID=1294267 RepID=A0A3D9HQ67_9BACL|nr:hypothetical protein [Cohnella lupini]RED51628.1 hypothetical protein DFP95_1423 [Cohnella lupini]